MNSDQPSRRRYDVVIVGARCAGASTALLLARHGLRVLVIDRGKYGTDTMSTHALMRGAVLQLSQWGVLDKLVEAGTPAIETTSFYYGDEVIDVRIKPRDGIEALYAPRRTLLDRTLVDCARESGAEFTYGTRLAALNRNAQGRVCGVDLVAADGTGHRIECGIVIGADGVRSTVARMVESEPYHRATHATGTVFAYWSGLDISGYHWFFRPGTGAGAISTNDGDTCVFVAVPDSRFRKEMAGDVKGTYHRFLAEAAPELASQVLDADRTTNFRGFPGIQGFMRQSHGPGWALVGDAGYFRDPLTAHGITDALRDAELLSRAVTEGTTQALERFQSQRDDLAYDFFRVTDAVASFDWDIPTIKSHHMVMSREMNREVDALLEIYRQDETGNRARALAS